MRRFIYMPPSSSFTNIYSGSFAGHNTTYLGPHVTFGDDFDYGTDDFTITASIKVDNLDRTRGFIGKGGWSTADGGFGIMMWSTGAVAFYRGNNIARRGDRSTTLMVPATWYRIAWVRSGNLNQEKLYINGAEETLVNVAATGNQDTKQSYGGTTLYIATLAWSGNSDWDGLIDHVQFWPYAFSAADALEDCSGAGDTAHDITKYSFYGASGFASSVKAMNVDFENESWNDKSQNAYVGTPVNSPTFSTDIPGA